MRHVTVRLAAAAIAAAGLAVAHPAHAQDMGSNPITDLFDAFGMGDKEKPEIEYRERPALVPPSSVNQLPAPQAKGAVGQATGQWPSDPDVERRARQRAEADLPRTEQRSYRMGDRESRLDPSELKSRRVATDPGVGGYTPTQGDNEISRLSPSELKSRRAVTRRDTGGYAPTHADNEITRLSPSEVSGRRSTASASEPLPPPVAPVGERKRLTDPPTGYLQPAQTAPYSGPQTAAAQDKAWYQKLNPFSN
ncbi:hypothetical protein [Methylopila turkensis]|uniref:Uncharacterized protein n=1 Tax=Methylopila turkensis TaxID=1437816 RepID=A0A9W6N5Y0_9HYPH|nr:hypothetical protein [Methylopila turkensis]GLK78746.1 hypothetical protein GCM10008174_04870 [Methylopila turkensis]